MSRIDRASLAARWFVLTRETMPAMAAASRWPVRLDHCFMRICLDTALGVPWHAVVARPAIHNLTDAQLAEAVRVAEAIVAAPETLPGMNRASLEGRRLWRAQRRR